MPSNPGVRAGGITRAGMIRPGHDGGSQRAFHPGQGEATRVPAPYRRAQGDPREAEMAGTSDSPITGEGLAAAMALIDAADSVELKLTIPESARWSTISALDIDPLDAQMRQVYFLDTPDLVLDAHGVVVRARRVQRRGDDSVVKLRPVVPAELPAALRKERDFVVEVDAMPGGYVCSGSFKGSLPQPIVREAAAGKHPLRKLFNKAQRRFFAEHAPEGIELDDLTLLGPVSVMKLKFDPPELARRLVAEVWVYPDGSRLLELSTKCSSAEPFQVAAEARAFLAGRGIDVAGEHHTKTRTALEFFTSGAGDAAADTTGDSAETAVR